MEPLCLVFYVLMSTGPTIPLVEAGILDPIRNIFDNTRQPHDKQHAKLKQIISPLRETQPTPNNYAANNVRLLFRHQNQAVPTAPYEDPGSTQLPPDDTTTFPEGDPNRLRGLLNKNEWFPDSATQPPTMYSNLENSPSKSAPPPDYDTIIGQRFPEALKLLEHLKRLNKLKESQRKQSLSGGGRVGTHHNGQGPVDSVEIRTTTAKSYDNDAIVDLLKPEGFGPIVSTGRSVAAGNGLMKKLTKRKFYYQAQPVRPVNENSKSNETVYYTDL